MDFEKATLAEAATCATATLKLHLFISLEALSC